MSVKYLEMLVKERDELAANILTVAEIAATENRALTGDENTTVTAGRARVETLDTEIRTWNSTREAFGKFQAVNSTGAAVQETAKTEIRSAGQQFVESTAYKGWNGKNTGRVTVEERATIDTQNPPGWSFQDNAIYTGNTTPTWRYPLLNLVNNVPVNAGGVDYIVYGDVTEAAEVAEGALKPEAVLTANSASGSLKTIAHWVDVTRQAVEDSAMLRAFIDNQLIRGVEKKVESLTATAALSTLGSATGADLLSAIRSGIGVVQGNGYDPNGVLLNPADYADIDIAIMGNAGLPPSVNGGVWGLTIAASPLVPAGTAVVGDLNTAVTLFYRKATEIYITDSDADKFIRNIFTVLGERRVLPVLTTPNAVVKCTAAAAASRK